MSYKSSFFFIAKCLQLKVTNAQCSELVLQMKSEKVNWVEVVNVASSHLVLPLLYIRLKESDILQYLPEDLQTYLKEITDLNRRRNTLLLEELTVLNKFFAENNIQVIYLKGTAMLLKGLYSDVGERMIGDVDFLVAPDKMEYVASKLIEIGYKPLAQYDPGLFDLTKHYPRMVSPERNFALEIHKDVIQNFRKRKLVFANYDKDKVSKDSFFLPSVKHLIWHNVINTQLNDSGYLLSSLNLRQQYDLLLLSQIAVIEDVIVSNRHFRKEMFAYLVKTKYLFNNVTELSYQTNLYSKVQVLSLDMRFSYPKLFKYLMQIKFSFYRLFSDAFNFCANMFHPVLRKRMLHHLTDRDWLISYFLRLFSKIKSL